MHVTGADLGMGIRMGNKNENEKGKRMRMREELKNERIWMRREWSILG
jgi:hypothetical protein